MEGQLLQGRRALVTGSSGGIGAHIAVALARAGADVAVNYRTNPDGAEQVASRIRCCGRRALVLHADVTRRADCLYLVRETVEQLGSIDILINNAGEFAYKRCRDHTPEEFDRIIASTVGATFTCSMAALDHMRQTGWGRIVNLGAAGAERAGSRKNCGPHMAGKAGVVALARTLAVEEASFGITFNVVCPGIIKDRDLSRAEAQTMTDPMAPVGRPGTSEDVVDAVMFLVSPQASYVNGAVISVTGGWEV
ncbi:MAG: SDR family NAD(P)-dependent oxidoreductase [Limnochordia bacterium]|jgi:3-oxoacyl-[acyl-carrier protein] reductase